jgi:imidazolonepropionase
MKADVLFANIARLVTPIGGVKRGLEMSNLHHLEDAVMAVKDGLIIWIGHTSEWMGEAIHIHNLSGKTVIPGLVDPHTHAVWAGNRLNDFEARTSGVSYEEILRLGGGIRSTMKYTQAASLDELVTVALPRLWSLIRSGATTIEVKSGYGFTMQAELKMLEAIQTVQAQVPARLAPTLLIHVPPKDASERKKYVEQVCTELIPEVSRRNLASAVDVFTEKEAFSLEETEKILTAAKQQGLSIKLHADQFHAMGSTELAANMGALSVDHLEASGQAQIGVLAHSSTVATLLPGVTLHLGLPAAPARQLIEAGAAVAVGTDLNPGSSPVFSTQLALALAVRLNHLSPAEALSACTINAAAALGLNDCGRLELGTCADFCVVNDWREVAYALGMNPIERVFIAGKEVV